MADPKQTVGRYVVTAHRTPGQQGSPATFNWSIRETGRAGVTDSGEGTSLDDALAKGVARATALEKDADARDAKDRAKSVAESNAAGNAALDSSKSRLVSARVPKSEMSNILTNQKDYRDESNTAQQAMGEAGIRRAQDMALRHRQNAGVNTARTPEMLRSEHYARLADRLNNASYWRPSVFYTAAGQPMQGEAGTVYQMPRIETEDQRQQDINRQRWGEKLGYQELGVPQAADTAMLQRDAAVMGELTNIDKLRTVQPMQLEQMLRVNAETLNNEWNQLPVRAQNLINTAAAGDVALAHKYMAYLKALQNTSDPRDAIQLSQAYGIGYPSLDQLIGAAWSLGGNALLEKMVNALGGPGAFGR